MSKVRFAPIVLKRSFLSDAQGLLGPLMRRASGDVRDHIVSHKNDHGPSYRRYGEHPMMSAKQRIEFAIEVFVRGHSAVKSRTHPYEVDRFGSVWVMRDAPRKQSRDYRKEEWIAFGLDPHLVDAIARAHTRAADFLCAPSSQMASRMLRCERLTRHLVID
jgi:hypothetical protein